VEIKVNKFFRSFLLPICTNVYMIYHMRYRKSSSKSFERPTRALAAGGMSAEQNPTADWPSALSYWRRLDAEAFDHEARTEVAACIARITSTMPEWRRAIRGDAAAATALALRLGRVTRIDGRVDLAMTVILCSALENAGAALALSYAIRRMPLGRHLRGRLATSWLVRTMGSAPRQRTYGCRSIRFRAFEGDLQ
jgi:hypothetical protein